MAKSERKSKVVQLSVLATRLKTCPMCGAKADIMVIPMFEKRYAVTCTSCSLSTRPCKTPNESAMLWNYRIGGDNK